MYQHLDHLKHFMHGIILGLVFIKLHMIHKQLSLLEMNFLKNKKPLK